jgi:ubiquinone/menaquinone biosynthesis C-methylase UbiE
MSKQIPLDQRYKGEVADTYLSRRIRQPHWKIEQKIVWKLLKSIALKEGSPVVDVPVGTGRFFDFYERLGYNVTGYDISEDMLRHAKSALSSSTDIQFQVADIHKLPNSDKSVDAVICIRYMQHVGASDFEKVLNELNRVTRRYIVLGIHMASEDESALKWLLKLTLRHPLEVGHRLHRLIKRRAWKLANNDTSERGSEARKQSNIDKPETRVRSVIKDLGLNIRKERTVLSSLNPKALILYKIMLLERNVP